MSDAAKKLSLDNNLSAANAWNRRILIVDDEVEILNAYENLLQPKNTSGAVLSSRQSVKVVPIRQETESFELVRASSFDSALQAVEKSIKEAQPFAMAFFDVRLGEQRDGVELAREVKKLDSRIGIVFVTAYNDRSLDSIASVLGSDISDQWDFVNKPFNDNEIVQKAKNLIALWNLRREREQQDLALAELNRRVLQGERTTSVAAVARGVTHEFGNLLMQIIGKAEISRNKNENEMREALDRIIDAGVRASEILDRFNNLSDNKSAKSQKNPYALKDLLSEALDLVGHLLNKESIKVNLDIDSAEAFDPPVHATSMLQVFINLFINAVHAMEGRSNKQIYITAKANANVMDIRFRDNGPGAPEEFINRLTEPLFTTKGPKGTGLGLAICKEIVEIDHGGEFSIANSSEGGFEISMSLNKEG